MSLSARAYGLNIHANVRLPGLDAVDDARTPDVRVEILEGSTTLAPALAGVAWPPAPVVSGAFHSAWTGTGPGGSWWRLRYFNDTTGRSIDFVIDPAGRRVWGFVYAPPGADPVPPGYVTTLLLGSVLGVVLRLRGVIALHGSVVAIGSRAVLLVGAKGVGKSSLAASLAAAGQTVLADDVAAVTQRDGDYVVHAGYPRLRLWPTTIETLGRSIDELPPVFDDFEKRYVDLGESAAGARWAFEHRSLPLGAVVRLTRRTDIARPAFVPIAEAGARLAMLVEETFVRFLPLDHARRATEFGHLGRLAATVPMSLLQCPEGLQHLPGLCDALVSHVHAIDARRRDRFTADRRFAADTAG